MLNRIGRCHCNIVNMFIETCGRFTDVSSLSTAANTEGRVGQARDSVAVGAPVTGRVCGHREDHACGYSTVSPFGVVAG